MELLIWIGAALTVAGVGLLAWCVLQVMRARRQGLDDTALRARLQSLVAVNLGALAISALGLMTVVAGLVLS
ncbi:MAG: hypothetical protein ACU0AT_06835 [Tranquillimonas sp.]|jgi:hypothetical protein